MAMRRCPICPPRARVRGRLRPLPPPTARLPAHLPQVPVTWVSHRETCISVIQHSLAHIVYTRCCTQ